jgi:hypothetical protein
MNWKKHEGSLLKVFSDAGSTPAASTIYLASITTQRFKGNFNRLAMADMPEAGFLCRYLYM